MLILTLRAYMELIRFSRYVGRNDFATLYAAVHRTHTRAINGSPNMRAQVCRAIDIACAWYWRRPSCLQRSAATTCLLRYYGAPAQLVIAAQRVPFKAHAWAEIDGEVVNDSQDVQALYAVLDRF